MNYTKPICLNNTVNRFSNHFFFLRFVYPLDRKTQQAVYTIQNSIEKTIEYDYEQINPHSQPISMTVPEEAPTTAATTVVKTIDLCTPSTIHITAPLSLIIDLC